MLVEALSCNIYTKNLPNVFFSYYFQNVEIASSIRQVAIQIPNTKNNKNTLSTNHDRSGFNDRLPISFNHVKNPSQISEPDVHRPTQSVKVLLLGAAESGKSTLVHQIKLINGQSFTDDELLRYKKFIRSSCLELFALLVSEYIPVQETTAEWKESCYDFLGRLYLKSQTLEREVMDGAVALWWDAIIQEFLVDIESVKHLLVATENNDKPTFDYSTGETKKLRFSLDDPAYHFLPSLDRIMAKGYTPTTSDILSLRIPTTGKMRTRYFI